MVQPFKSFMWIDLLLFPKVQIIKIEIIIRNHQLKPHNILIFIHFKHHFS